MKTAVLQPLEANQASCNPNCIQKYNTSDKKCLLAGGDDYDYMCYYRRHSPDDKR
jgi:hypothetical protein